MGFRREALLPQPRQTATHVRGMKTCNRRDDEVRGWLQYMDGDGLAVRPVVAEAREHVPEVRRDHGHAREERGLFQRMRREAARLPTLTARQRQILARIVNGTESVAIAIRKQLQKI